MMDFVLTMMGENDVIAIGFGDEGYTVWILFAVVGEQRHALEVMSNEWEIGNW